MGLQLALNTARSSLLATSSQIAASARNTAGASDASYSRKIATLVTADGGARVVITRASDAALLARKLGATSDATAAQAKLDGLKTLSLTVGDTADAASPAARLGALGATLQAAANQPDNMDLARAAIDSANDLADSLNTAARAVQGVRADADAGIAKSVGTINDLLSAFDTANRAVMRGTAAGADVSDAQDDRDRILGQLSQEIGITTIARASGDMAIYTDSGVPLFERSARQVSFAPSTNLASGAAGNAVMIDGVAVIGASSPMPLASGRIAGLASLRDGDAAEYGRQLDAIAGGLIDAFAETDAIAGAQEPAPATGIRAGLFTGDDGRAVPSQGAAVTGLALQIRVAARVDPQRGGDVTRLRDGGIYNDDTRVNPANGDAGYPARLSALSQGLAAPRDIGADTALSGRTSLAGFAAGAAGWIEAQRKDASTQADYQSTLLGRAGDALSNAVGVNGDDETALTLQLERSYTASAKIIAIVDQLLQTLMDSIR